MGGLALIEFTKRHHAPEIQAYIDRVIVIDIPSEPVRNYPPYRDAGNMLKALSRIDLTQPLPTIHAEIDNIVLSKDISALLKTNLVKEGEKHRWTVNMQLLAFEGYDNIGAYSLA